MLSNSWKQHFSSQPTDDAGNQNMGAFSSSMESGNPSIQKMNAITSHLDISFLGADNEKRATLFHSPSNLGGSLIRPSNKVVCLIGLGPKATPVILDEKVATDDCNIATPNFEKLSNCSSVEEFEELNAPRSNSSKNFGGSNVFIIPPWMRKAIIDTESDDPFILIPAVIEAATKFDEEHDEDEAFKTSATSLAEDFSFWGYGVRSGLIPETRFRLRPDDSELQAYSKERHEKCILPANNPVGEPGLGSATADSSVLSQLNSNLARQNELNEDAIEMRRQELDRLKEKDEAKKDRTKKLHKRVLHMLRMIAGSDCDDERPDISEDLKNFLNSESAEIAEQEFLDQFRARGISDVGFAHGTVRAMYNGHFQYFDESTPSNFSAFNFFEQNPLQRDAISKRSLRLTIIRQTGQGQTLDEISKSNKQVVNLPATFDELKTQLSYTNAAWEIASGEESFASEKLMCFRSDLDRIKHKIKAKLVNDKLFATKILFAVDGRLQLHLEDCRNAADRSEVDESLLNLKEIIRDVMHNRFAVDLPPSFEDSNSDEPSSTKSSPPSKKRKRDESSREFVTNDDPIPDICLREGETFKENFGGKLISERPKWDKNSKMCSRWFIKHSCFSNCAHKASHVPSSKVPEAKKDEMKNYVKKVRAEN